MKGINKDEADYYLFKLRYRSDKDKEEIDDWLYRQGALEYLLASFSSFLEEFAFLESRLQELEKENKVMEDRILELTGGKN